MARPISDKQRLAYQRNSQHSTGPRTPAGKLNSRLNAVKHGLTAKLSLLPFESESDFAQLRDGFLQDFAPRNTYQQFLTTQLATQAWRILRSQQVEIGLQELLLKQTIHDLEAQGHKTEKVLAETPFAGLALTFAPQKSDPHNHLHRNFFRYSRDIQSSFHRTRQALFQALQQAPPTEPHIEPEKPVESITPGFVSSPLKAHPKKSAAGHSAPAAAIHPAIKPRKKPLPFDGHPHKS